MKILVSIRAAQQHWAEGTPQLADVALILALSILAIAGAYFVALYLIAH